jgi:transcriptional regulator with XRE-family HTH domain
MTPFEKFGAAVRSRREHLGYSQEKLAEFSGMHRTYIGGIERGERNVSLRNILKLCESLKTKPSDLLKVLDEPDE